MKCVLPKCGQEATYIFTGLSLCEEHLVQFQRNMSVSEPLAPVLNQVSIIESKPEPVIPVPPILLTGSGLVLANYEEWKGRKDGKGGYHMADGTWGWEFADKFPPDIVSLIMSAPQVVGDYEYSANKSGTTIQKRKA